MSMKARALSRPLLIFAALAVMLVAWSGPALAHTELRATTPEEGSAVESLSELRLEFTGDVLEVGAELTVVDAEGVEYVLDPQFPSTNAVTGTLDAAIPAGDTELVWRIVAEDGHPLEGVLSFTYAPVVEEESVSPGPTTEPSASAEPTPEVTESTPAPTASAAPAETEPGDMPAWVLPLIALVAAGGALVAILAARARQR
ncbi:copper resistance CopC family protein [Demequina sp. SO4-13]|uniref:copper resistance CopC family protein n=1 Tax=Demequina sp. SO4-13 TaxID=3401027 RepID=UPI003AF4382C